MILKCGHSIPLQNLGSSVVDLGSFVVGLGSFVGGLASAKAKARSATTVSVICIWKNTNQVSRTEAVDTMFSTQAA